MPPRPSSRPSQPLTGLSFLYKVLTPLQWLGVALVIVASAGATLTTDQFQAAVALLGGTRA